jgi:hypothetical protein
MRMRYVSIDKCISAHSENSEYDYGCTQTNGGIWNVHMRVGMGAECVRACALK